jgi:DNA-binding transcriptional regulator YiaG
MAKNYQILRDKMLPERRAKNDARAEALLAEMPIHELRRALQMSQEHIAEEMNVKQGSISKLEARPDHLISTIRRYVEAMGGELELKAHFPIGSVSLSDLGEVDDLDSADDHVKNRVAAAS